MIFTADVSSSKWTTTQIYVYATSLEEAVELINQSTEFFRVCYRVVTANDVELVDTSKPCVIAWSVEGE